MTPKLLFWVYYQLYDDSAFLKFASDKSSDSFASHFASLIPEGTVKKNVKDFIKIKVNILWQGDPLSCLPTFGTRTCKLCTKERYAIIKLTRMTPHLAINKCNEVHGACHHRPRFHRFDHSENTNSSTDESVRMKESQRLSSTTSAGSTSSTITDKICMMMTRLACNRAIESSYWRMDNNSDVGLLTGYVLYRLPIELESMDLDTFSR